MAEYDQDLAKVNQLWSDQANVWSGTGLHWLEHPAVQDRISYLVTRDTGDDRFQYFLRKYFSTGLPVDRAITLGCGPGEFERGLAKYNFARRHDAIDIAEGALEKARIAAASEGWSHIHYQHGDLNQIELPPATYDAAFGISSIHHVANLEHLFAQVRDALKPGGYFLLDEYIGASQYQWPDSQVHHINATLATLPESIRRSRSRRHGEFKSPVARPTIEEMNAGDPSEAVRSADIIPLVRRHFDVLEIHGYGGGLLHMLLEDITGNFRLGNREGMKWLSRVFEIEDELMSAGDLDHDFALIIARKPT